MWKGEEEVMIKERLNEEEIVQHRPVKDTQTERIHQRVECDIHVGKHASGMQWRRFS